MYNKRFTLLAISIALGLTLVVYSGWRPGFSALSSLRTTKPNKSVYLRSKVGLLVGHWKSGPGATCPDGIKEVDINLTIAQLAMDMLQQRGYQVELLADFDPKLRGYKADVLIALHADSCLPYAHGFKVAGPAKSQLIRENERLIKCLWTCYEAETGLVRQLGGITHDMLGYYAFQEIDPKTPAAIIEMGFISGDRSILLDQPTRAARGIVEAIECFLSQK